ncbi:FAD-dependent oxidoreductase [Luteimonas sp. FCS-9]|uniref:FAD-dependent oxidoreductase n=1 Tax=Luteimonas sp. FCS-9 TaxID=1547516 RepID=UPI00063EAFB6|nr:FAD-dependent oxidoreductase [Luteimonas sp. FCS-9]KLI99414.1 amine oxidase [Luteimonas sp. FCS-9]
MSAPTAPFAGFWQAGFEGADHVNGSAQALCMNSATGHLADPAGDYRRMARLGLRCARESAGWRSIERAGDGRYDFDGVGLRARAARAHGIQLLWTFFHYGMPQGLDIFSPTFVARFADYAHALARFLVPYHMDGEVPVYTPVNEISFLAWAVCETGLMHPHRGDRPHDGHALKMQLVRAAIAATDAIHAADPRARILSVDPLIHVVADTPERADDAQREAGFQYHAWDMLAGRLEPQPGGSMRHLDIVGINYYPHNQWIVGSRDTLRWPDDPRRRPLSALLLDVHARYGRPMAISETSHTDAQRGPWLADVCAEVALARDGGARVDGICLYPALDRPDWEQPAHWHRSGLWHVQPGTLERRLDADYAQALARAQHTMRRADRPPSVHFGTTMKTLIVFSHLRWGFVYQRPQHLLGRLAAHWDILFVEEPVPGDPGLHVTTPAPGVTVLQPRTRAEGHGFADSQFEPVGALLRAYLAGHDVGRYGVWLYTPMALPLLAGLAPEVVVYDCMDELSAFKDAPPQLLRRETTLLDIASVVFTGGPSLYDAKRTASPNVHALPSSVDAAHFAPREAGAVAERLFAGIAHPRLGYYGVIDERLDLDLLAGLADARPDWQVCLVGPVVKIDPASLPQRANLHYLPQQAYEDLPEVLAAWDVCLMPFARNEATRFISPTKTLEYMGAGKPVVSTEIADVRRLYADGVALATGTDAFVAACEAALGESGPQREARQAAQRRLVARTSWDAAAETVAREIGAALAHGLRPRAKAYLAGRQVVPLAASERAGARAAPVDCLIVGAGPTGLSAALHYGAGSLLVEANDRVGGWCRSIEDHGFVFDYAGHIMFSNDADVLALYEKLLGDNLHWQDREAWIYSKGVHTRYPFQSALYGLPTDVLKECLVGAIEARFGAIDGSGEQATPRSCDARAARLEDCCADGVVPADPAGDVKDHAGTAVALSKRRAPRNFEAFIYEVWGAGVARHFAVPYNLKLWTVPLREMETSWLGGRVPLPDLEEMIDGALRPVARPVGPNARFGYPRHGGFQALMDGFLPHLEGELLTSTRMTALHPESRVAEFSDGRQRSYRALVSTLPLPELVRLIGDEAPEEIRAAAAALRHVSVRCVNLGIGRAGLTDKHWIYYPEDTVFHRIFVQGNASPHNNPPGGFGLTCEITYSPTKPLPCDDAGLVARCIAECRQVGMLRDDDPVLTANVVDMPYAYVIYDHARAASVATIRQWLAARGIVLAGRYSEWEYYNSDHAFLAGKRAAQALRQARVAGVGSA